MAYKDFFKASFFPNQEKKALTVYFIVCTLFDHILSYQTEGPGTCDSHLCPPLHMPKEEYRRNLTSRDLGTWTFFSSVRTQSRTGSEQNYFVFS